MVTPICVTKGGFGVYTPLSTSQLLSVFASSFPYALLWQVGQGSFNQYSNRRAGLRGNR